MNDVHTLSTEDAERQQAIIESGDGRAAYYFAKNVQGADIQALQRVVINCDDDYALLWVFTFARNINGADIQALQQVILDYGDGAYAYMFAKHIPGADIQALQQVVVNEKGGHGTDAYYFAKDIHGADIQALQRAILLRGDAKYTYLFARDIPAADLVALHSRLLQMNSAFLDMFTTHQDIHGRFKVQLTDTQSKSVKNKNH